MPRARFYLLLVLVAVLLTGRTAWTAEPAPVSRAPAAPVVEGRWVRPAAQTPAKPVWGHADGMCMGLHPMRGPRGLLRIYAPYLGQPEGRVINFLAVEPIPAGETRRGLSELEPSRLDQTAGKRFWSADAADDFTPRPPDQPARGTLVREGGVEMLRTFIFIEPFENGSQPYLRLTFRADRPHEVGVAVFRGRNSRPMDFCIITATMGNYARLRRLDLASKTVLAKDLWPDYRGNEFAPHVRFPLADLGRTREGHVMVAAVPDEKNPQDAEYAPSTNPAWKYRGAAAAQYWRCEDPDPRLAVQVNGRRVYWGGQTPIPGGVAFENFEMVAPFREGQEFWFGVTPRRPEELIEKRSEKEGKGGKGDILLFLVKPPAIR